MRLQSRRARAEQAACMTRLRDRIRDLESELLEQGRANGRLAASSGNTEAELREEIRLLRLDRDGLLRQLDRALGYDDAALTAIAAGAIKKELTAR